MGEIIFYIIVILAICWVAYLWIFFFPSVENEIKEAQNMLKRRRIK